MSTDHYAEAERLLGAVGNTADAEDRRQCLMEAQVHVGLAGIDETRRMSALMNGVDEALSEIKAADAHTIPWPPSDELRNSLAVQLSHDLPHVVMRDCYDAVCNLLDAIEARIAARTPGDWELGDGWVYTDPIYDDDTRLTPIGRAAKFADPERQAAEWERVRHDLDLIAHAPDDLAAVVAEVRATTADLAVAVEVARERGEEIERLRAERRRSLAETHALLGRLSRTEAVADAAMGFYGEPGSEALDAALDALDAGGES